MFTKELIREALQLKESRSPHIKDKRILFQTRRPFTEMLETYRLRYAPSDRDNDPLFLPRLCAEGQKNEWLQDCPWEVEREEPLSSQYRLNLSIKQFQEIEGLGYEHGWTIQRSISALIYTGLLLTYPKYSKGDMVKIQVLTYEDVPYQPNQEFLGYDGKPGILSKKSNNRLCWESVNIAGVNEPVAIRKDWILPA